MKDMFFKLVGMLVLYLIFIYLFSFLIWVWVKIASIGQILNIEYYTVCEVVWLIDLVSHVFGGKNSSMITKITNLFSLGE